MAIPSTTARLRHIPPPGKATPTCSEELRAGFKAVEGFHAHSAVLCISQSTE